MKFLAPSLAAFAVLGGGCSLNESGQREKEEAALAAVRAMEPGRYISRQFPSTPKSVRCVIRGDERDEAAPDSSAPGICTTIVTFAADGTTVVMFRETWDARDFDALTTFHGCPAPGPCFRPQTPTGRTHTWEFTVTKEGEVSSAENYGDGPPQYGFTFW